MIFGWWIEFRMTRRSRVAKVFSEISALLSAPSKWLRVTLRGPGRLDNILHVLIKLTATLESPVTTQTDPSVRLLRSAYRGAHAVIWTPRLDPMIVPSAKIWITLRPTFSRLET